MKDHQILMTGAMVRATLEGRKTQTRRIIKGFDNDFIYDQHTNPNFLTSCPYGVPGDRLWVRETWMRADYFGARNHLSKTFYKADEWTQADFDNWRHQNSKIPPSKWKPSIHMPKWACRLWLSVISVRVERLQDISAGDAIAEGIELHEKREHYSDNSYRVYLANTSHLEKPCDGPGYYYRTGGPTTCFRMLWGSINAKRGYGWESNPWVWVVEFERIEP